MSASPQYEEAVSMALRLSTLEKVRLVERIVATLDADLTEAQEPAKSLYGVFAHLGAAPSAEDIDEVRREMWGSSDYKQWWVQVEALQAEMRLNHGEDYHVDALELLRELREDDE